MNNTRSSKFEEDLEEPNRIGSPTEGKTVLFTALREIHREVSRKSSIKKKGQTSLRKKFTSEITDL